MRRRPCTGTTSAPTSPEFTGQGPGDGRQVPLESSPEMGLDMSSASRGPCLWDVFVWQHWRGRRHVPVFARTTRQLSPCVAGRPRLPADIKVPCSRSRTSRTSVHCLLDRLCRHAYRNTCPPRYRLGWPDRPSTTWCPRYAGQRTWASCHPPSSPSIGGWPREDNRWGASPISVPPRWLSCVSQRASVNNVLRWGSGASATRSGCEYPKRPPLRRETCEEPAWPPSSLRKWGAHPKRSVLRAAGQLAGWAAYLLAMVDELADLAQPFAERGAAGLKGSVTDMLRDLRWSKLRRHAIRRGGCTACYHRGPHLWFLMWWGRWRCLQTALEYATRCSDPEVVGPLLLPVADAWDFGGTVVEVPVKDLWPAAMYAKETVAIKDLVKELGTLPATDKCAPERATEGGGDEPSDSDSSTSSSPESSWLRPTLQPRRAMLGSAQWGRTWGNAPWAPSSSGSDPLPGANHAAAGVSGSGDPVVP